ncbi:NUDIX domain-containing protein [Microbacterium paludicola]|uniref:NUDIX domain-containing protein n=1 Tax=Microbacterium paludicola TaxID=300019 RepID=A0A4Y9FWQ7_9MICO|nr:NUDIX domain-containing protein [Microbacterium paludicola]MBF0815504.1 NUDIX domain-containing protein [Microbacterium paludicola]TFU33774.1 NUDIX domain-containing protein [Microbacterium paludicola]
MPTPEFVLSLRAKIGTDPLWLSGVTAVVLRGDEVLLVRRADNGHLTPVTGIIDPGEEPAVAAEREVLEEAGVVAEAESLVWVHTLPPMEYDNGDQAQYLDIVFRCRYVSGEPHPADGENSEALWRRLDDLADVSAEMRERILLAASNPGAARFER